MFLIGSFPTLFAQQDMPQRVRRHVQAVSNRRNLIQANVVDIQILTKENDKNKTYFCKGVVTYPGKQVMTTKGCFNPLKSSQQKYSVSIKSKRNESVKVSNQDIHFTGEFVYIDVPTWWKEHIVGLKVYVAPGAQGLLGKFGDKIYKTFLTIGYDLVNVGKLVGNDKFQLSKWNKSITAGTPVIYQNEVLGFATTTTRYDYYIKEEPVIITPNAVNGGSK